MFLPSSTYRLQFNKEFTFQNLQQILPYLIKLGPGAVYASPVFSAVPGSNHGYDVTHPNYFNPEIGTADEFRKIGRILRKKGIGWIQDIVPNHMALHPDNHWLMDVLKHGQTSEYAAFFDIDWNHPEFKHKVMIPILGDSLLNSLKNGQIKLWNDTGALFISFGDFRLPVNAETKKELENRNKDLSALCTKINSDISALTSLLARQYYVLTHWQKTDTAINYRRFFTINGLISLKMDDPRVFEQYHRLIFRMLSESLITGIRIDHIDGLKKPIDYFGRLRSLAGEDVYIVAEKILERNETFDNHWPLQGSSGYDFLALVNGLFTGNGISNLSAFYSKQPG